MNRSTALLCLVFCLLYPHFLLAEGDSHWRNWETAFIQGPLSNQNKKLRYYIQPLIGFEDNHYKYNRTFLFVGPGYQFSPNGTVWLLLGSYYDKRSDGKVDRTYTLRQQFNWVWRLEQGITITNFSRLEERKHNQSSALSLKIRQSFWLRAPFPRYPDYSLVIFDEMFFNLNNPAWVNSNTFFEQNRAFIGFGKQFSKTLDIDIGYLNQTLIHHQSQRFNVLYLIFNVLY